MTPKKWSPYHYQMKITDLSHSQTLYGEDGSVDEAVITCHMTNHATMTAVEFPEGAAWVNSQPLAIHG